MQTGDYIEIRNIEATVQIGVHDYERQAGQRLLVHLRFGVNTAAAAATDQLSATTDYQALVHQLQQKIAASRVRLLETLAEQLADYLLHEVALPWIRLELVKPHIFAAPTQVALVLERTLRPVP